MAIREYIGARYVPRFLGAYDATTIYEALDVVDNGMGTSYIAKKTVPAGTALTDTDYWFVYGASSGAILDLQNRMSAAEDTIDRLANHKYILIHDSYGSGITQGGTTTGWCASFIAANNLTLDVNCFTPHDIPSLSGDARFSRTGTQRSFYDEIKAVYDNYTTGIEDEITDIIVLGGSNDLSQSGPDITSGVSDFMIFAKTNYPNAKIKVGVLMGFLAQTRSKIDNFEKVIKGYQAAQKYGAIYISNSEYICANKSFFAGGDGTHPNVAGYAEITKYTDSLSVADHVDVCYSEYIASGLIDYTGADISSGFASAGNVKIKNDVMRLEFSKQYYFNMELVSPLTIGATGLQIDLKVGTLSSNLFNVNGAIGADNIPVTITATDLSSHSFTGPGFINLQDNGAIYLKGYIFNGSLSGAGASNIDKIFINGFTATLPTYRYCF